MYHKDIKLIYSFLFFQHANGKDKILQTFFKYV